MKKINKCNLCGSKDLQSIFVSHDRMHNVKGDFSVFKCEKCGLLFLNPQPNEADMKKYYPKNYYSYTVNKQNNNLKTHIYKTYFSKNKNILLKILFLPLKRNIRTIKIKEGGKFLDVGCGSGNFLNIVKNLNMRCYGVEPGKFNKKYTKKQGFKIFNGKIEQAKYPNNYFDSITLNHVFEHVENPMNTLKELRRILKKDGVVNITVPQKNSLAYWIFGRYWIQLDVPRHLYLYSEKNLKKYTQKTGFKIKSIRYISSPFQFTGSISYFLREKKYFILDNIIKSRFFFLIFFPISYLCNRLHIGDTIEITIQKNNIL